MLGSPLFLGADLTGAKISEQQFKSYRHIFTDEQILQMGFDSINPFLD
jgi:hypothetical protein